MEPSWERQRQPYMHDPTVRKFLQETGKRPHRPGRPQWCLAKKADRKPGWNKPRPCDAADAGELGYAAGPAAAGPDVTPRTASRRSLSSASSAPAASTGPAAPWSFLCAYASAAAGCWRGRCGGSSGRLHGRGRGGDPPATAGPEGAATAAMPNAAPPGTASEGAGIPGRGRFHGYSPAAAAGPHADCDAAVSAWAAVGSCTPKCGGRRGDTDPSAALAGASAMLPLPQQHLGVAWTVLLPPPPC